jgi:hypothetical protein
MTGVARRASGRPSRSRSRSRRSRPSWWLAPFDASARGPSDSQGSFTGETLRDAVTALTSTMRSYDVTVRRVSGELAL